MQKISPATSRSLIAVLPLLLILSALPASAQSEHTPAATGPTSTTPAQTKTPGQQPNPAALQQARVQACLFIDDLYNKEMTANLQGDNRIPSIAVALTIKRHVTLQRLIQLSWANGCDMRGILAIESQKINQDYQDGVTATNRSTSQHP